MMSNLFSIFDPSTNNFMSLNWISLILPFIYMNYIYWSTSSRFMIFWFIMLKKIFNEFYMLVLKKFNSNLIIFISLMIMIMLMNMLSLFPYVFTPTSHMMINISWSLTLWLSFMMFGWLMNYNSMFIHLVPMNTPLALMNFMVLIETISNLIRPWTLAIRLTANMLAGHLLLSLLGSSMNNLFILIIPIIIIIQNLLFILEISVSMIQSYVFSILSVLYFNESNH